MHCALRTVHCALLSSTHCPHPCVTSCDMQVSVFVSSALPIVVRLLLRPVSPVIDSETRRGVAWRVSFRFVSFRPGSPLTRRRKRLEDGRFRKQFASVIHQPCGHAGVRRGASRERRPVARLKHAGRVASTHRQSARPPPSTRSPPVYAVPVPHKYIPCRNACMMCNMRMGMGISSICYSTSNHLMLYSTTMVFPTGKTWNASSLTCSFFLAISRSTGGWLSAGNQRLCNVATLDPNMRARPMSIEAG